MAKKKNLVIMLCLLIIFGFNMEVSAKETVYKVSYGSTQVAYNSNTGKYAGIGGSPATVDKYITINGTKRLAYCSALGRTILESTCGTDFVEITSEKGAYSKRKRLIAAKAKDLADEKWTDKWKHYLYVAELMNGVFGFQSSHNFFSKNPDLKQIYDAAVKYVDKTAKYTGNSSGHLPSISLKDSGGGYFNATSVSGKYLSSKITLSGMVDNYGSGISSSANGDTTYTITVSSTNGTAEICTDASGINCETSVTKKKTSGSYDFYIKLTGASATGSKSVVINVSGKNKSKYRKVRLFKSKKDATSCQILVLADDSDLYSRSVKTSLTLDIPSPSNHSISVYKVDEDGNSLSGADFNLYKANKNDDNNTKVEDLASNSNGGDKLVWSKTFSSADTDDFFNWKYCVQETNAPQGFILKDPVMCYEPKAGVNKSTCVDESGNEVSDTKYCTARYDCADSSYTLSGSSCLKTVTTPPNVTYTCPENSVSPSVNEGETCEVVTDPALEEPYCAEGSSLDDADGKCHATGVSPVANSTCTTGTFSDGNCVSTDTQDAVCVNNGATVEDKYCTEMDQYMMINQNGNNFSIRRVNKMSSVTISKKAATGDDEIPGAVIKICSSKPNDKGECEAVKLVQKGMTCPVLVVEGSSDADADSGNNTQGTNSDSSSDNTNSDNSSNNTNFDVDNVSDCVYNSITDSRTVSVEWTSGDVPRVWEGLPVGTYYLVETLPPSGYVPVTTSTEFTIQSDGTIKIGGQTSTTGTLVLRNELTKLSISKQDIATSKEIPDALISICEAYQDEDGSWKTMMSDYGECGVAVLYDGSSATWTSTDKPHDVVGLPAGTYYLVERIAPNGYSTAESILFTLKSDGTLADINGNSLKDNKIVMKDAPIKDVKTGSLGTYVVMLFLLLACVGGVSSYLYLKKKENNS